MRVLAAAIRLHTHLLDVTRPNISRRTGIEAEHGMNLAFKRLLGDGLIVATHTDGVGNAHYRVTDAGWHKACVAKPLHMMGDVA